MSARFYSPEFRFDPDDDDAFSQEEIDDIVELVRESSFYEDESGRSIDERLCSLFSGGEADWFGFQAPDGCILVNCRGAVDNPSGGRVELELQFELSDDLESFVLAAMLIDGLEQTESFISKFEAQFGE